MTFDKAFKLLKKGKALKRKSWEDKFIKIDIISICEHRKLQSLNEYILSYWEAGQGDIMADDWIICSTV